MIGKILNSDYKTKTYTADEALEFGQAVYVFLGKIKGVKNADNPVEGFVAKTEHDLTDSVSAGDTVTVLSQGEITLKKATGSLGGVTKYHTTNKEISAAAAGSLVLYGVQAVEALSATEARVRVSGAISII